VEISQAMGAPAATVGPSTSLTDAVALMVNESVTELPVVDESGELIGIVGEADLFRARMTTEGGSWGAVSVHPYADRIVSDLMRRPVISVRISDSFALCQLRLMGLARSLPVLDGPTVVGVITRANLLATFARDDATGGIDDAPQPSDADRQPLRSGGPPRGAVTPTSSAPADGADDGVREQVTVDMVMSRPVMSVSPEQSIADAWAIMNGCGVRHVAVTSAGHCVGVIDDRQLAAEWPQGPAAMSSTPVSHLLGRRVACVLTDTSIGEAAAIMKGDGVEAVPVTDPHGELLGLVTTVDILQAVARWGVDTDLRNEPMPSRDLPARRVVEAR
jgi:CBS domain-containing protein